MESAILVLLIVLVMGVAVVGFAVVRKSGPAMNDPLQATSFLQQQFDGLRGEVSKRLDATVQTVTTQLASITQQLNTNTDRVSHRLDNAAGVIRDVDSKLGELKQATQDIKDLGSSVSQLGDMLKAPKLRGGLGELLLEDLLKQVLPAGSYEIQYAFKNGQKVDAVIRTSSSMVAVDAKFPFENFKKMIEAKTDQDKRTAQRLFQGDVRKHVDTIADKYIRPDEGTFDFALMYIPAENIYYETIIKDDLLGENESLHSYAIQKHVVPVSPNSFYAHLMVIALGFKGLQIEQNAREIQQNLQRLVGELRKFVDLFETLGSHLNNARNKFEEADKQLDKFSNRLNAVQSGSGDAEPGQLSLLPGDQ